MPVITLTSDYGATDIYLPRLRGKLLAQSQGAQLVDISNHVSPFSVHQAAFLVKNSYSAFEKGTVHLILVDEHPQNSSQVLLTEYDGHYFLYPDNGLTGLLFERHLEKTVYAINKETTETQPAEALCRVAAFLARGGKPNLAAQETQNWEEANPWLPSVSTVQEKLQVVGRVLHIDHYGNLITNISSAFVQQHLGSKPKFVRILRMRGRIRLVGDFAEIKKDGSTFAIFQDSGHLAIGIFKSVSQEKNSAYSLLGLKIGDEVILENG